MRILLVEDEPSAAICFSSRALMPDVIHCRRRRSTSTICWTIARAGGLLASEKNVTLELTNPEEAEFHGDEDLLRQMVLNLVDNAVKFTPPRGAVKLDLRRRDGEYILSISDTGPGISPEARSHVFERSYRGDKARMRAHDGGAGLGLAIANWIANAHDGELELVNSDQNGATFVARLPIAARN